MKIKRANLKVILSTLLCLAILGGLFIPAVPLTAATQDWPLQLVGASTVNLSKTDFETLAAAHPSNTYTDSSANQWKGAALWRLIALVDDGDPNTFNSALTSVYSIKLTAADGFSKTIAPSDYTANFVFANSEDVFVANKVMLSGTSTWVDLPITRTTDSTKLWYPTMDTGSGIAVGNMRVAALIKIELLNLPAYTIATSSGSNGTVTANPAAVISGGSSTVTITPNTGYHIASLTVDGSLVAPIVSSYTFTNVTANHTIAATFAAGTQDWPLQLVGAFTVNMSKTDFETLAAAHPSNTYTDSSGSQWKGVALWRLIAKVDDGDPNTFNSALTSVYSIKLTAADGFSKTIAPSDYAANFVFANSEDVFVANKVMLGGTSTWVDLPLTRTTDSTKLWYPTMDTGSGIAVGNMRVAALIKIELLNLPATTYPVTVPVSPTAAQTAGCSVSGAGNYASGASVSLTPSAAAGWAFSGWTSSDITISNSAANPLTFTMPAKAVEVTATFALNPVVSVGISPSTQSVAGGNTFNVSVTINTNTPVRGWQTNIDFDASKLTCNSITEGTFLSSYASSHSGGTISAGTATIDNTGGHVAIPGFAISNAGASGPSGTATLCTLSFMAKNGANGSSNIMPSSVIISDVNGTTIAGVTVTGGSVTITPSINAFTVNLTAGWNTFSTPVSLDPSKDTLGVIMTGAGYDLVYRFNPQTRLWEIPTSSYELKPIDALCIHMTAPATVNLSFNPNLTPPPSLTLYAGWNLIGLASLSPMKANDALVSVEQVTGGLPGYTQALSLQAGNQTGWIYIKGHAISDSGTSGWMQPGMGYWVFMINNGTLAGFTTTP